MKVIVAGLPKTGTKSMTAALTDLGYKVYDYSEHLYILGDEWRKIVLDGGTTEDFRRMYKNVDAVTDIPACYFWDEIHRAFPDAKVILTVRDNEGVWMDSFLHQIKEEGQMSLMLMNYLSPTMHRMFIYENNLFNVVFGTKVKWSLFGQARCNQLLFRMAYRRHNSHVVETAPKNKLLVFNVKQGWEPLCKFLGNDIPNKPFPRKNVKGEVMNELLKNDPVYAKCKQEMIVSLLLISFLIGFGGYKLFRKSTVMWIWSTCSQLCYNWSPWSVLVTSRKI